jgi:uncharacterized protein (TIGR02145 family)
MKSILRFLGLITETPQEKQKRLQAVIDNDPELKKINKRLTELNDKANERLKKDSDAVEILKQHGINIEEPDPEDLDKIDELVKRIIKELKDVPAKVVIGEQIWDTRNLSADRFANGDKIPFVSSHEEFEDAYNDKQPAWCYPDYNPLLEKAFGKIYNWYAVNDPRGLAPKGWRIPKEDDWIELIDFLGGEEQVWDKLASKSGWDDSVKNKNETGFTALPGGSCDDTGRFDLIGEFAAFWSCADQYDRDADAASLFVEGLGLYLSDETTEMIIQEPTFGFYVRCLKKK